MMSRHYLTGPAGQIHYRERGDASAPVGVLLLHPLPFDGDFFAPLVRALPEAAWLVAPDYPGFGQSDAWPGDPGIGDIATSMHALAAELAGSRRWITVGFHTGCLVAAELSLLQGSCIARNVMIDVPYFSAEEAAALRERVPLAAWPPADTEAVAALYDKQVDTRRDVVGAERAFQYFRANVSATTNPAQVFHAAFDYPCDARFAALTQPTTVVATGSNLNAASRRAAERLRDSDLIELPDIRGHAFEQHADAIVAAITPALGLA